MTEVHLSQHQAKTRGPIGIERYMAIRNAYGPAYSHDGRTLYFLANITGVPQVWAQQEGVPWPKQITLFPDRVMGVFPNPVRPLLCISADQNGTENAQRCLCDQEGFGLRDLSGAVARHLAAYV